MGEKMMSNELPRKRNRRQTESQRLKPHHLQSYDDYVEGEYVEPGHDVTTEAIAALYDLDTRPGPNAGGSIKHPNKEAVEALGYIARALEPYMEPKLAQALTIVRRALASKEKGNG